MKTRSEVTARINILRGELEARHKYGTIKIADSTGTPIPTKTLQEEMFKLIYRLSRIDAEDP
jgi:hypothetical protein